MQGQMIRKALLTTLAVTMIGTTTASCSREEIINRGIGAAIGAGVGLLQASSITPEVERQLGAQVRAQILQEYKLYTASPAVVEYVRSVGNRLAAQATRRNEVNYTFDVVDSREINAFAIPGGGIFVTTELLKYLNNEAELAGVLGHEISHVEDKHSQEALRRAMVTQGAVQGGLSDSQILTAVASLTANLILRGFSRDQEREADRDGVKLATRFNYDEQALSGFLQTLLNVQGSGSGNGLVTLFQTHPNPEERITLIRQYITQNGIDVASPVTNAQGYKAQVAVLGAKLPLTATTNP